MKIVYVLAESCERLKLKISKVFFSNYFNKMLSYCRETALQGAL